MVMPNGVDVAAFRPDHRVRAQNRAKRGVGPDDVVAIFVGGDWDRKGLAVAIGAIAEARRLGTVVRLWVLGSGNQDRFRRSAVDLGVADLIDFIGQDNKQAGWYMGADLFLGCSVYETFSLAIVEAASAALPVVSTPVGVAEAIVLGRDDEENGERGGVLVERDPVAFGGAIVELALDASRRNEMGLVAQRRSQAYSWDNVADQLVNVYDELLMRSPRGPRGILNGTQGSRFSDLPTGSRW
jgi:UDP-glucose:(heptosyl)LPS alpha-1,3-glucosyltransferase